MVKNFPLIRTVSQFVEKKPLTGVLAGSDMAVTDAQHSDEVVSDKVGNDNNEE